MCLFKERTLKNEYEYHGETKPRMAFAVNITLQYMLNETLHTFKHSHFLAAPIHNFDMCEPRESRGGEAVSRREIRELAV